MGIPIVDAPPCLPSEDGPMSENDRRFKRTLMTLEEEDDWSRFPIWDDSLREEKAAEVGPYDNNITHHDLFYGTEMLGHFPLWGQERHAQRLRRITFDLRHEPNLKLRAVLQYSLCLFLGFGVMQDINKAVEWFLAAADDGNRKARAVVERLLRSYDLELPISAGTSLELISQEARSMSQLALKELRSGNVDLHREIGAKRAYQRSRANTDPTDLAELVFTEPQVLQDLLKEAENRLEVDPEFEVDWSELSDAISWACCCGTPEVFSVLFNFHLRNATLLLVQDPNTIMRQYLSLALECGRVRIAHAILDWRAMTPQHPYDNQGVNPLFFLSEVTDDKLVELVRKIVSLGENINEAAPLQDVVLNNNPLQNLYLGELYNDNHWKQELRGLSMTPLRWAIINHRPRLVEALLNMGAEFPKVPSVDTYVNNYPWDFSPEVCTVAVLDEPCYDIEIVKMFLDRHGDNKTQTVFSETPLGLIATQPESPQRQIILGDLARAENLYPLLSLMRSRQPDSDAELFRAAAKNGRLDIVQYLYDQGVDIDIRCSGLTPLHTATLYGSRHVFDFLLDHGADPGATTTGKGISLVHLVFWKAKPAALETHFLTELSRAGLQDRLGTNCRYGKKVYPLHLALLNSRVQGVAGLVELGADRSVRLRKEIMPTVHGARFTPWGAERSRHTKLGDSDAEDHGKLPVIPIEGCTPMEMLVRRWDMFLPEDLLKMLKLLGAKRDDHVPDDPDRFCANVDIKQSVLHLIASYPILMRTGIFEFLLQQGKPAGLHINMKDIHGDTPLHYASLMRGSTDEDVIRRLMDLGADPGIRNAYGMTPCDVRHLGHVYEFGANGGREKALKFYTARASAPHSPGDNSALFEVNRPFSACRCLSLPRDSNSVLLE